MKIYYSVLFTATLSLFSSTPSFSMEETDSFSAHTMLTHQGRVSFVKRFVPQDSSEDYIEKVANCYRDALTCKKEIVHDNRPTMFCQSMIMPNTVSQDYGWNFPPVPRVQIHLLEYCAQAKTPVNMMDIGAGYGIDSLFALLTKNIKTLYAVEGQKAQCALLKQVVTGSIQTNVDPGFPLKGFNVFYKDFLTLPENFSKGAFHVLNANKVIHFFAPAETQIFAARVKSMAKKGARFFATCLTASPGSEIEAFMSSQEESDYPGFVFYRLKTELLPGDVPGESTMLEVRKPTESEKSAHFFQTLFDKNSIETHRVMHYHTAETLKKMLEPEYTILETMILTPEETYGTDHMISIVAERN